MVKRLRRRPLTAETGVRFPVVVPKERRQIFSVFFLFTLRVDDNPAVILKRIIGLTDYPFFKERKKVVSVKDIHKIKWRSGGQLPLAYLVFKNQENKTLFKTLDLPEIRAHFAELGFEIT